MKERREYMFTLVRQWRESCLTRKEFCLQHGITMAKFGYWTRRWKEDQLGGDGGFIPMAYGWKFPQRIWGCCPG